MSTYLILSLKGFRVAQATALGFFVLLFMAFAGLSSFAQSMPVAELNSEGIIVLPVDQPLVNTYSFDASHLSFESSSAHFAFFDGLNNDLFLIRVNPETMEGRFMLRTKNRSGWDINQWNDAIRERCEDRPIIHSN